MILSTTIILPTSTYVIEDKCVLKLGEQQYETLLTYTIYIVKERNLAHDVTIERSNFKVNHHKIDTKFLEIANQYMEAIFPLRCRIKEYRLFVTNVPEIHQRIQEKDKKLQSSYSGEGLQHIRSNFLNAIKNEESLREFIKQLYFMKILGLSLQKFDKREIYQLQWNFLPIGNSVWRGEINFDKNINRLIFEPQIENAQEIMDSIIKYIHKHDYAVNMEQENVELFADFYHKTEYSGETSRMKSSQTKICIDVENIFLYEQELTFKSI